MERSTTHGKYGRGGLQTWHSGGKLDLGIESLFRASSTFSVYKANLAEVPLQRYIYLFYGVQQR